MIEIMWHRWETKRQAGNTKLNLSCGETSLPTPNLKFKPAHCASSRRYLSKMGAAHNASTPIQMVFFRKENRV